MTRLLCMAVLLATIGPATALAQGAADPDAPMSPELFAFDIRLGPYQPYSPGNGFRRFYQDDKGPMLQVELDMLPFRIPYVGRIGGGLSFGWSKHTAGGCIDADCNVRADQNNKLTLLPVTPMAVLRVDVLARELGVPLVFAGKIGADFLFWREKADGKDSGYGVGLHWAAQVALELDWIEPRRARGLDEDWGINHTYLFIEFFGIRTSGLRDPFTWAGGLGLSF